jgi:mannose-1-phosphate guanylyltransferase/mannose-6-phosphate isomerase
MQSDADHSTGVRSPICGRLGLIQAFPCAMSPPAPLVPVILSGGAGTRLWPLSREMAPKAFMPLPDGETLLAKTAVRAMALPGVAELVTVTNRDLYFHTRDVYTGVRLSCPQSFLLEPFGRNTAPAVALAALHVQARRGDRAVLLVLPADHLIRDQAAFARAVDAAKALADEGVLATFGVRPAYPETGFGYLECGDPLDAAGTEPTAYRVRRFVEKPPLQTARAYVAAGNYVWNSGIFCFTTAAILDAFARHAPQVLAALRPIAEAISERRDTPMFEIDPERFASVPDVSIDYAVMEPAGAEGRVAVVRGAFDWSDIGSWQAVSELTPPDAEGNHGYGERVTVATRNTFVHAQDRTVATVGVDNLVIVDTPDAVLVAHRDHVQRVREVAAELKARGNETYRYHRTVTRPWGAYTVLQEGTGFKLKRIEVKPGASISLQLHRRRSEHWVVVAGAATVTRGTERFVVGTHESTFVPVGEKHRLENAGTEPLIVIEVQCGDYVGEDDIVRFEDVYGRVK